MPDHVVTVTPTIMDGRVVRWFTSVDAANRCNPILSASRNAVVEHQPEAVTPSLRASAQAAHVRLDRDRYALRDDLSDNATHERPTMFGDYVPIERGAGA